jgi:hypothetical protein
MSVRSLVEVVCGILLQWDKMRHGRRYHWHFGWTVTPPATMG